MCTVDGISIRDALEGFLINSIPWKGSNLGAAVSDGAEPLSVALFPSNAAAGTAGRSDSTLRVYTSKSHQLEIALDAIATDVLMPRLLLHQDWLLLSGAGAKQASAKKKSANGLSPDDFRRRYCAPLDEDCRVTREDTFLVGSETASSALKTLGSSAFRVYSVAPHPVYPSKTAYATNAGLFVLADVCDLQSTNHGFHQPTILSWSGLASSLCRATLLTVDNVLPGVCEVQGAIPPAADFNSNAAVGEASQPMTISSTGRSFCLPPKSAPIRWTALSPCGAVFACATISEVFLFASSSFAPIPVPPLQTPKTSITGGIAWNTLHDLEADRAVPSKLICLTVGMADELLAIVLNIDDLSATAQITTLPRCISPLAPSTGGSGTTYEALFGGEILAAACRLSDNSICVHLLALVAGSPLSHTNSGGSTIGERSAAGAVSAQLLHLFRLLDDKRPRGSGEDAVIGGWTLRRDALVLFSPQNETLEFCTVEELSLPNTTEGQQSVNFVSWRLSLTPFASSRSEVESNAAARWSSGGASVSTWSFAFAGDDRILLSNRTHLFVVDLARVEAAPADIGRGRQNPITCAILQNHIPLASIRGFMTDQIRFGASFRLVSIDRRNDENAAVGTGGNTFQVLVCAGGDYFWYRLPH